MTTTDAALPSPARSLPGRLIGVIFAPRATYAAVAARPRWFGALAFVVLMGVAGTLTLFSTEVGREAWIDAAVQQREAFSGRPVGDEQYAAIERMAPYAGYIGSAFQVIVTPIAALVIAGVSFAVFNALLGGDARFRQVFAIVAHSGAVLVLVQLFNLPLAYARQTLTSPTTLGVFAPFLEDTSFAARLLGAIDLVFVWWAISLAIGLGVLYRKRTAPIATTLLAIYGSIGLVIAVIKTLRSGA